MCSAELGAGRLLLAWWEALALVPMSWSELDDWCQWRKRALRHCRSRKQLILAARRLSYKITRTNLQRAWQEHQQLEQEAQ